MELLPTPHERSALLDALSRLIEARGFETFVRAPLLEPSSTFFPDAWEPSRRGVRALSLRLLAYVGLDEVDASVELYGAAARSDTGRHEGTAAWFAGIDADGVWQFGADRKQLALGDSIVGTMCHEIAHAFREHHGLVGPIRQIEEEDTDLTTIYLGFGILTTNNAYRFRKSGELQGGVVKTSWSTSHTGYLSPQAMAFLLAAQAVARRLAKQEVRHVAAQLETNQAAFFRASHDQLAGDADALAIRLGMPPREVWPAERTHRVDPLREDARFVAGAPDADADARATDDDENEDAPTPSTRAVTFRVRTELGSPVFIAMLSGFFVGFVLFVVDARLTGGEHEAWVALATLVAAVVGARVGRGRRVDRCSDPHCEAEIPPEASRCPKCRALVRGTLARAVDRLVAEEAIEQGRDVDAVLREAARGRFRRWRRILALPAVVLGGMACIAYGDRIPHPMTVRALRQHLHGGVTARLAGDVLAAHTDHGVLVRREDNLELVPFSMGDDTDTLEVWVPVGDLPNSLAKGDHVRVWGRYVDMTSMTLATARSRARTTSWHRL